MACASRTPFIFSPARSQISLATRMLLLASTLTAAAAHATENAPTGQATASSPAPVLPEVSVTGKRTKPTTEGTKSYTTDVSRAATGLNLSLRDTPQSVTVVTRERIDDQNMLSLADVIQNAPGVSAKPIDSVRQTFYSRGLPISSVQIDGLSMTWNTAESPGEVNANLALYDRVEIVRGATGLLSGTGNPSASINLVRKHADSKVFKGSVGAVVGSWDRVGADFDITTPLNQSGSVRARLVVDASQQASFIDQEKNQQSVVYGVVDADLTSSTRLSVGLSEQRDDRQGNAWSGLPIWYADGSRTDFDRSKTTAANWNLWDSQQKSVFATLTHQLDNKWSLQTTAAQRRNTHQQKVLWLYGNPDRATGLGMDGFGVNWDIDHKQNEIGIQVSGPVGRGHELSFGLNHSKQELTYATREQNSLLASTGNFNRWDGSIAELEWTDSLPMQRTQITESGLHGAGRMQLTETTKLIGGVRAIRWRVDNDETLFNAAYQSSKNHLTPYLGLVQDLGEQVSIYASYADIFGPQLRRDRNAKFLDPMTGKNAEIGIKAELLDGRLQGALSIFRAKQDNLAQRDGSLFVPGSDGRERAYFAAQDATTKGHELTLTGALTSNWLIDAGWSQFSISDGTGQDLNTDQPRRMLKVFTRYKVDEWTLGGGVNWESKSHSIETNPSGADEKVSQGAHAVANLMVRYEFSKQLSAQLNINNVFDKKYYANQIGRFGNLFYGEPRNAQLAVKYTF